MVTRNINNHPKVNLKKFPLHPSCKVWQRAAEVAVSQPQVWAGVSVHGDAYYFCRHCIATGFGNALGTENGKGFAALY